MNCSHDSLKGPKSIQQELLEKKGYYYTLYNKQFEEEAAMQVLTGEG